MDQMLEKVWVRILFVLIPRLVVEHHVVEVVLHEHFKGFVIVSLVVKKVHNVNYFVLVEFFDMLNVFHRKMVSKWVSHTFANEPMSGISHSWKAWNTWIVYIVHIWRVNVVNCESTQKDLCNLFIQGISDFL